MAYDKEEYESLIEASQLFSLDKEKERTLYRREALKMVEYLYCYLMAVNSCKYEPFGVEIVDTAKRCIDKFNPSFGRFLNYFNAAWKKTYGHVTGKELVQEAFTGIHFVENEERNYRKYMKLAQTMGMDIKSAKFERKVAEAMGLAQDELEILRRMIHSKPVSGNCRNEDGEEYSLIDQIDSGCYADSELLQMESAIEFLDLTELVFDRLQERQKPMLAALITSKLSIIIGENQELTEAFKNRAFFHRQTYEECMRRGEVIQAKEIAEQFGAAEAGASRAWKNFREKIKAESRGRR